MSSDPTRISAQPPPESHEHHKQSRGLRAFNMIAYGGLAGVATFLLSLPVGYAARYTKAGQQAIKWTASKLRGVGMSEHAAEDVVMTTALMQGGNLMIMPVKHMEDRKEELVSHYNKLLHDDTKDNMTEEPRQTWGSLLKSRIFLAWTPVFVSLRTAASMFGKDKFDAFEKGFAKNFVCDPAGLPTHVAGQETRAYKLGRIAAIDLFATAAAASLLYVGSRIFGVRLKDDIPETPDPVEAIPVLHLSEDVPATTVTRKHSALMENAPKSGSFAEKHKPSENYKELAAHTSGGHSHAPN